jgi:peptide/nickel transport system substrate-binding protein
LRFVLLGGPDSTYEGLKSKSIQAAYLRDPATIAKAKSDGFGTVDIPAIGGSVLIMNSGIEVVCAAGKPENLCAGKAEGDKVKTKAPTTDVRVRRAVAAAIDPDVVNQRAYDGHAEATSAPFAGTPFDPKVPGPKYDPVQAKKLVQDARAAGWDGKIRLLAPSDTSSEAWAIAIAAMLQQAGMEVSTDTTKPIAGVVAQVTVQRDFDAVSFGYGLTDEFDGNYTQLLGALGSKSPRYGYASAELDAAIDLLRTADTLDKRTDASRRIAEILVRDVPSVFIANIPQAVVMSPKVHGVVRNAQQNAIFGKAWIAP